MSSLVPYCYVTLDARTSQMDRWRAKHTVKTRQRAVISLRRRRSSAHEEKTIQSKEFKKEEVYLSGRKHDPVIQLARGHAYDRVRRN
jgi:hypothetical protein